jgi:DNA repair exonuclease SbcCD ATPase subunit
LHPVIISFKAMTIAVANQAVDRDDRGIRAREAQREALRARIYGAQTEPEIPSGLVAKLEAEVKKLDAEIRELKAAQQEAAVLAGGRPEMGR